MKTAALIVTLVAALGACTQPYEPIHTLKVTDPELAAALAKDLDILAAAGFEQAADIALSTTEGTPVGFAPSERLQDLCTIDNDALNGCTRYVDWSYTVTDMWFLDALKGGDRLEVLVMHELIHALFPGIEHLSDDQVGVFTLNSNSPTLTIADLALMRAQGEP